MRPAFSLTSRRSGRLLAALGAIFCLGIAGYTAITEVDPVLHIYDGLWMCAGGAAAVLLVTPLVWRWPRERALAVVAAATAAGTWAPLAVLALRARIPLAARVKGAIFFSSADVVGIALPVGVALAWLAIREHRPAQRSGLR